MRTILVKLSFPCDRQENCSRDIVSYKMLFTNNLTIWNTNDRKVKSGG